MIEEQLGELTAEIGGMPATLWVRIHLKEDHGVVAIVLEGHIPASSYIANNVLTLYTDSTLKMPSYLVPPPMVRFIEVIRESGAWGVKLIGWTQKIPAIKNIRRCFKALRGTILGLKEAKEMVEAYPIVMVEGLDKTQAEIFMREAIADGYTSCCLVQQGNEVG